VKRRDWREARQKVEDEGRCRVCRTSSGPIDAAHVIPRSLAPGVGTNMGAENIVPLCRECHVEYDQHRLDLLPVLTLPEQVAAVRQAGGIALAYRRTTNERELS
jgi:5-methylcytosine-specific restriction endonuclease McrA